MDEEDLERWGGSKRHCDSCNEVISYLDEVYLLQICTAQVTDEGLTCLPLEGDDGFSFVVYLLHLDCWDRIHSEVQELVQDVPPLDAKDPILICTICESLIGEREAFISATFAELHVSQRQPSGHVTDKIERLSGPDPVCLECMAHSILDHFPDWEDVLTYMPEGYLEEEDLYHGT